MANYLITGSRGENHVTSNDAKAFNRSYFGSGKYILDGDELSITISPQSGTITINSGSLLWNGMQIRLTQSEVTYTPPAAVSMVKVYFHYAKSGGVESVTAEAFVDSDPTPIVDNPQETAVTAYTLFMSFSANTTSYANLVYHFEEVNSFEEMYNQIAEKIAEEAAKYSETVLFSGLSDVGQTITLSEPYTNFEELRFYGYTGHDSGLVGTFFTENVYGTNRLYVALSAAVTKGDGTPMLAFSSVRLTAGSSTSLTYNSNNHILIDTAISQEATGGTLVIKKIVGVRRK